MTTTQRRLLVCAAATIAVSGGGTLALAAAPTPTPTAPPVVGDLPAHTKAKQDGIELKTRDDAQVASFTLHYPVGAESGWHRHPGIVLAVVESGTVTRQVGCDVETFTVGDAFTEVEPHFVRNVGATPALLRITHVFPAGATRRADTPPPVC